MAKSFTNKRARQIRLLVFSVTALLCTASSFAAHAPPGTRIRIATAAPSLSYFPIYAAVQKGFFARRGFDVEMIQMAPTLTAAALLNRSVDYTIIPAPSPPPLHASESHSLCIGKAATHVGRSPGDLRGDRSRWQKDRR